MVWHLKCRRGGYHQSGRCNASTGWLPATRRCVNCRRPWRPRAHVAAVRCVAAMATWRTCPCADEGADLRPAAGVAARCWGTNYQVRYQVLAVLGGVQPANCVPRCLLRAVVNRTPRRPIH